MAIAPRSTTTTFPTLMSSRTSKSTVSSTLASLEDIVRANLILTGVSSARPNASGGFAASAGLWVGTGFGSVGAGVCCERPDDQRDKQTTSKGTIFLTEF